MKYDTTAARPCLPRPIPVLLVACAAGTDPKITAMTAEAHRYLQLDNGRTVNELQVWPLTAQDIDTLFHNKVDDTKPVESLHRTQPDGGLPSGLQHRIV